MSEEEWEIRLLPREDARDDAREDVGVWSGARYMTPPEWRRLRISRAACARSICAWIRGTCRDRHRARYQHAHRYEHPHPAV